MTGTAAQRPITNVSQRSASQCLAISIAATKPVEDENPLRTSYTRGSPGRGRAGLWRVGCRNREHDVPAGERQVGVKLDRPSLERGDGDLGEGEELALGGVQHI